MVFSGSDLLQVYLYTIMRMAIHFVRFLIVGWGAVKISRWLTLVKGKQENVKYYSYEKKNSFDFNFSVTY